MLIVGDLFNVINGDIIIGPYCAWPKREPRYFIVTSGRTGGKSEAMLQLTNSPEFIERCNAEYTDKMLLKELNKNLKKQPKKFYQKLNAKKW